MAVVTHKQIAEAVQSALQALPLEGYRTHDIQIRDWPFHQQPPYGLIISPLTEQEGESTNETSDIGYPLQITRCLGNLSNTTGFESRDNWRRSVYDRFNRVRLGLDCELMTRCEFAEIEIKPAWDKWNLDSSVLRVTTWIRVPINRTV